MIALALDEALHIRLVRTELDNAKRLKNPSHGAIPSGFRYEEPSDIVH